MDSPTLFPSNTVELLASDSKTPTFYDAPRDLTRKIAKLNLTGHQSQSAVESSTGRLFIFQCNTDIPRTDHLQRGLPFIASRHLCIRLLDNQGITLCLCTMPAASLSLSAREISTAHLDNCPLGGGTVDRHDALARVAAEFFTAGDFLVHKDFHKQGPSVLNPTSQSSISLQFASHLSWRFQSPTV
jgi:hypothetical protein